MIGPACRVLFGPLWRNIQLKQCIGDEGGDFCGQCVILKEGGSWDGDTALTLLFPFYCHHFQSRIMKRANTSKNDYLYRDD